MPYWLGAPPVDATTRAPEPYARTVKTVVLGPPPVELAALIARRHALGIDLYDEVWEGSYHMAPAPHPYHGFVESQLTVVLAPFADAAGLVATGPFNLGGPDDFRVPDKGYHRGLPAATWVATAAVVVEVVSPDDETYDKFGFYARHGVDELVVADPAERSVTLWRRDGDAFVPAEASGLLAVSAAGLTAALRWP